MKRIVWTTAALANLRAIRAYLAQFNPDAAEALAARLIAAGNTPVGLSHRGRRVPGTDMRELVAVRPYAIRYRVTGDDVVILRVRHTARRPTRP